MPGWVFGLFFAVVVIWGLFAITRESVNTMPTGYAARTTAQEASSTGECVSTGECGVDGCLGSISCQGNNIVCSSFKTNYCYRPGRPNSQCYSEMEMNKVIETCNSNEVCRNSICVPR